MFTAIIYLCLYLHSLLPAALGVATAYALSITCALILFCRDGRNDYKCAWLAVIAALPVVGAILYAFSCTGAQKSDSLHAPPPSSYCDCEYFKDGARYLSRLTACIANAEKTVFLEFYIIFKGEIWMRISKEIERAIERGVKVRIIYDGFGSSARAPKKHFKRLVKKGAEIKVFNKLLPFPVSRLNCRNHRKIAVIDGQQVFLGGVNIADEYANISSPHGYWKDGGVALRGEIAALYEEIFLSDFYGEKHLPEAEIKQGESPENARSVMPVTDAPEFRHGCYEELVTAKIYAANERVFIFTPYLCVGEKLKDALSYAAKRGVDVRIIIPEIPDKRITFEISLSFADELLQRGIRVYRFTPGFMHAKAVICDGEVGLGSYNFDYRSMRLNYECGIWTGGELAADALADFNDTMIASKEMKAGSVSSVRKAVRGALKLLAPLV